MTLGVKIEPGNLPSPCSSVDSYTVPTVTADYDWFTLTSPQRPAMSAANNHNIGTGYMNYDYKNSSPIETINQLVASNAFTNTLPTQLSNNRSNYSFIPAGTPNLSNSIASTSSALVNAAYSSYSPLAPPPAAHNNTTTLQPSFWPTFASGAPATRSPILLTTLSPQTHTPAPTANSPWSSVSSAYHQHQVPQKLSSPNQFVSKYSPCSNLSNSVNSPLDSFVSSPSNSSTAAAGAAVAQVPSVSSYYSGSDSSSPARCSLALEGLDQRHFPHHLPAAVANHYLLSTPDWVKAPQRSARREGKTRTAEKYRQVYSDFQRLELEKEYWSNKYIAVKRKTQLSETLSLSERQIKIWFQNRRAKERNQSKKAGIEAKIASAPSSP